MLQRYKKNSLLQWYEGNNFLACINNVINIKKGWKETGRR